MILPEYRYSGNTDSQPDFAGRFWSQFPGLFTPQCNVHTGTQEPTRVHKMGLIVRYSSKKYQFLIIMLQSANFKVQNLVSLKKSVCKNKVQTVFALLGAGLQTQFVTCAVTRGWCKPQSANSSFGEVTTTKSRTAKCPLYNDLQTQTTNRLFQIFKKGFFQTAIAIRGCAGFAHLWS